MTTTPGAVIEAHSLGKRYGTLTAVTDVSFSVAKGEIFGLLGPNGAGKTTTLEMFEGLRTPDAGQALIFGQTMRSDARDLKERIGVQLQATLLPAKIKVREAVELFAALYHNSRQPDELLAEFGLTEKAKVFATSLSGGQMQRLSIALALLNEPELVFLDEPTTGLDPKARLDLWHVIEDIRAKGTTVVLTTHYMEEAERLCDRVGIMDQGRLVALDTPAQLITTHAAGTSIEFAADAGVDSEKVKQLAGVHEAQRIGDRIVIHTEQPERVLTQLLNPEKGLSVRNLIVRQGTLEDVFLTLTGRRLEE